ncbi:glycosyltransferase family 4 protein [Gammaproteobacteria bacterium]|nr:glycosyltransferase family 4 protein [Gammaproteobacteria bacterium]
MRLLMVSQYFWPESFPINDICSSLSDRGVELDVLTAKPNYPGGKIYDGYKAWGSFREKYNGINVNRIPLLPRGESRLGLILNYLSFVFSGTLFGSWMMRGKKVDVIFVYAPSPILQVLPALFLGFLKKSPVVVWVQDLWPESLSATGYVPNRLVLKLVAVMVRFIYKRADLILVQSPAFVEPVRKLVSNTPIEYHPNSVIESFSVAASEEVQQIKGMDGVFPVLFAGNIGQAQAVGVIVETAVLLKDYNDIQLVVMGDGSARQGMLDDVKLRNLNNLHLPGKFPVESMPGFMQQAAVLLVTLADREIFAATVPSKVQAYMAAGRPIVACLNGEGARLVEEAGAGFATPAEDARALADTILKLYRMPAGQRDEMGSSGREYYQRHFNHDDLIDRLIGHLQGVAREKSEAR